MSNFTLPEKHLAVISTENPKGFKVVEKALPATADDQILVKVKAVSLNPADWKYVFAPGSSKEGNSIGCDFAGNVIKVGKNAGDKGVKEGDAVAGFVLAHKDPANGSFQSYVVTRPELVTLVPLSKLSYEQAATLPVALSTAVMALFHRLNLPTPWEPAKEPFPIVVWGGSTSIGLFAIRLAKLANLQVAATASPKNHELLKEVGADVVFDYRDPDAPQKIKEWSKGQIEYGLDPVSEGGSPALVARAFSDQGGKLELVQAPPADGTGVANVQASTTVVPRVANPDSPEFYEMADWYRRLPEYAEELNVVPIKIWDGGVYGVPDALDYMKAGKVSGQKIVLQIA